MKLNKTFLGLVLVMILIKLFDIFFNPNKIFPGRTDVFSWVCLNQIIYGKLACIHCKQGSICCPALKFFTKGKNK